ncbi:neprilysin-2-like [Dermacentor silvarum]|uniref:neprilysin-2-like n=1 Tax=Dermacentor silvarum TaxID=543639 RepID=UPI002100C594|nr:neprilysin-2-like [Dermacentor silvarum]
MHMYDVLGITYDENAQKGLWLTPQFIAEYGKRAVCVRRSNIELRKKVARQAMANDFLDSENLADFVGTAASYSAYALLPPSQRQKTLLGLNITAERLFFINHCVKYCNRYSDTDTERHSPFHVRCEVPLMHMPEFSAAFQCAPGSHMNPKTKCAFWS